MAGSVSPSSFHHRYDRVNGIRYHYVDEGPKHGPTVLLMHGFPDLWYGWRHQIKFLAGQGYRVICPDLRGYGQTDSPHSPPIDIRTYGVKSVADDMLKILDRNHVDKFVVIGHDWGGYLAWRLSLFYPSRLLGVGSFSTPYFPATKGFEPLETIVKKMPSLSYQLVFRKPESDQYFDDHAELILRGFYQRNRPQDDVVGFMKHIHMLPPDAKNVQPSPSNFTTEADIKYYIDQYTRRGFHGGLNYYRTTQVNWEDTRELSSKINIPALMVTSGHDPVLPQQLTAHMPQFIPHLTQRHIQNSSHWILLEQPDLANLYIAEFLESLPLKT
ncbi:alpha/beta-hydrolase [Basidiobolus meristosporus CBS 931.73]|uniref:Alpha/beta-hydrolase n=1 Tax=Basidiobolus meristosporus CBS 931.73 TaxID=1314790 RepID=A0A1Y1YD80_9FUNG|nr:alpha/beta-hydrolase [Basidiobolus meristosporus CBS 931.73]|eukprot:ORX95584.1 alpha/beta-hydrolase [Basidiobolus meristosporus CBS 931.73]